MRDYYEIVGPLKVPIRGKLYGIPPIDAATGARLKLASEGRPDARLKKLSLDGQYRLILGTAYDEMKADGVLNGPIEQAFMAAMADFREGREAAERVWEAAADPEFRAALIAAVQAAMKKPKTSSTGTASAKRTLSPESTRPTTSVRAASPKRPARASTGGKSSTSGA